MAGKKPWKQAKDKRDAGAFITVPMAVLNSQAYLRTGAHARMLLFDLFAQYRGNNNGDLCAAWKVMKPRGWRSEDTLARAKKQLLDLGLIFETRRGARPNKASLYAVTWCALDDCGGKLDISPRGFPRSLYRNLDPVPPLAMKKNASLNTASGVATPLIGTPTVVGT
jgi:hypothetical protein